MALTTTLLVLAIAGAGAYLSLALGPTALAAVSGDVNCDETTNSIDALGVLRSIAGLSTPACNDPADQMLTAGSANYGYDPNGNQTSRGSDIFTYDHENRLTQTVIGSTTSTSAYNGDGLRTSHTVSGQPTNYTWEVVTGLPRILQDGSNTYVYGLDLISATDGAGTQTYFSYDGLGSTSDLTNASGGTVATYTYDAFGGIRSQTGSSPNDWQFTGEQRDSDSSLYYLRARYYDPAIGRFLSQDPLRGLRSAPITQNRFVYSANNPVNHIDPSGLSAIPPIPGEKFPCPAPDPIPPRPGPCPRRTPVPVPCSPSPGPLPGPRPAPTPTPTSTPPPDGAVPAPLPIPIPIPGLGVSECEGYCSNICAAGACGYVCSKVPGPWHVKAACVVACSAGGCTPICKQVACKLAGDSCPPNC